MAISRVDLPSDVKASIDKACNYRLNVVAIELPLLCERREDIPALLKHFLLPAARRFYRPPPEVSTEEIHTLIAAGWPGNVRELRNVAHCLVLGIRKELIGESGVGVGGGIGGAVSSDGAGGQQGDTDASLAEMVNSFERGLINTELRRYAGNVTNSARALRVAKTILADKIGQHGLG